MGSLQTVFHVATLLNILQGNNTHVQLFVPPMATQTKADYPEDTKANPFAFPDYEVAPEGATLPTHTTVASEEEAHCKDRTGPAGRLLRRSGSARTMLLYSRWRRGWRHRRPPFYYYSGGLRPVVYTVSHHAKYRLE